ncbi:MarR family winged helix-turn-helix transcriptional regulator [Actinokineospora globicatena]|uniref:MarR family transcriptional regulator n=1 Tax=Actinokineospora globicatena TaxID=103729 RepID=A0A9W6QRK1_9PSEU|nr:MarR family transcriptional regulator [Actinokineospora globicatena]MCP2305999.1 DNA-binding transcriptional regulator, MarR family [Actinokineospora globicatena]GLW80130.1 MarR family transcriptional regulator [Actinokineospora globicatena]GLW86959.1 MarR family transcriptional regulator [Actinokineospora globicatena]GLW93322.1 MarR family transcriptional regulator [Actinokineospora globicatena]
MVDRPSPEPRWLDDDEHQTWMALATLMVRLPAALDRQLQRDSGLTHFEYQVMAGLSEAPDRTMRMSVLACFAEGQLPRLSQVATRLEKRGWLTRRPDPTDGRYTLATLTDEGMKAITTIAPAHVNTVRTLVFDALTKAQVRHLRDIGHRINHAITNTTPR